MKVAVSLTKGEKVNLSKVVEKLANVTVGLGEFYREDGEWHFEAVGKGTHDGSISELARRYR